jgi:mono/diheme cytochrome c family protein
MMAARRPVAALTCMLLGVACAANADPPAPAAAPANTPAAPAAVDSRPLGQQLYGRHCLSCHQADGGGVPNMQPAIAGGSWVQGDARALALFVMTGGFGSAERKESPVDNVMPAFRQLSDVELAQILTYIRAKFGNGASAVSTAQVAEARATLP